MEKSKIRVIVAGGLKAPEYISFLNKRFDVELVERTSQIKKTDVDLILFTGGEDVNPEMYGEKVGKKTYIDKKRDAKEIDDYYKFKGIPMLGICRGAQLLTVMAGARLIQDVSGHQTCHSIVVNNFGTYNMTSSHHQMMYPFDLREENYNLIAYSEYFKSGSYLNGDNEEISVTKDFLEPEIVYYKINKSLCIQGHPEWGHCEESTEKLCLDLIQEYLLKDRVFSKKPLPLYTGNSTSNSFDAEKLHDYMSYVANSIEKSYQVEDSMPEPAFDDEEFEISPVAYEGTKLEDIIEF
jgi:putative glutamine amidotransferase